MITVYSTAEVITECFLLFKNYYFKLFLVKKRKTIHQMTIVIFHTILLVVIV